MAPLHRNSVAGLERLDSPCQEKADRAPPCLPKCRKAVPCVRVHSPESFRNCLDPGRSSSSRWAIPVSRRVPLARKSHVGVYLQIEIHTSFVWRWNELTQGILRNMSGGSHHLSQANCITLVVIQLLSHHGCHWTAQEGVRRSHNCCL